MGCRNLALDRSPSTSAPRQCGDVRNKGLQDVTIGLRSPQDAQDLERWRSTALQKVAGQGPGEARGWSGGAEFVTGHQKCHRPTAPAMPQAAASETSLHTMHIASVLTNDTFAFMHGPCCPAIVVPVDMAALSELVRLAARAVSVGLPQWQLKTRSDARKNYRCHANCVYVVFPNLQRLGRGL